MDQSQEPLPIDWAQVDWTKPNRVLAQELGITHYRVGYYRRRLGFAGVPAWSGKSPDEWRKLNWTQSLAQLGQQMGVSPERVRQIRVQLGLPVRAWKPVPCKHRKPRGSFHSFAPADLPQRYQRQRAILRDLLDATLSFRQIARNHGVTTETVRVIRQWAARWGTIIPGRLKAGGFWSFTPENLPARYTRQHAILRDLRAATLRQQEIAAQHGVSAGTVSLVKKWAEKGGTTIPTPPRKRGAKEPRRLPYCSS